MIKLHDIHKTYTLDHGEQVEALRGIDLEVQRGEIFGVIGLSGAGKSTLIRIINMLERPTRGSVMVNGRELTTLNERELRAVRRRIGMIFQSFNLLSSCTVRRNVAFALELDGRPERAKVDARVDELLELRLETLEPSGDLLDDLGDLLDGLLDAASVLLCFLCHVCFPFRTLCGPKAGALPRTV